MEFLVTKLMLIGNIINLTNSHIWILLLYTDNVRYLPPEKTAHSVDHHWFLRKNPISFHRSHRPSVRDKLYHNIVLGLDYLDLGLDKLHRPVKILL